MSVNVKLWCIPWQGCWQNFFLTIEYRIVIKFQGIVGYLKMFENILSSCWNFTLFTQLIVLLIDKAFGIDWLTSS